MRFQDYNVFKTVCFCRKASNAGILGVHCSAQRDRKRAVRQPAAAPFRPLAHHHYPDIQGVKKNLFIRIKQSGWFLSGMNLSCICKTLMYREPSWSLSNI